MRSPGFPGFRVCFCPRSSGPPASRAEKTPQTPSKYSIFAGALDGKSVTPPKDQNVPAKRSKNTHFTPPHTLHRFLSRPECVVYYNAALGQASHRIPEKVRSVTGPVSSDGGKVPSVTGPVSSDGGKLPSVTGPVSSDGGKVPTPSGVGHHAGHDFCCLRPIRPWTRPICRVCNLRVPHKFF